MNFKHLHYFWVAAKAGGIMRAGEQLHTTPQTLSGQIKLLEEQLGRKLFRKNGRQLELTEEGRVAMGYAEEIFSLGAELEAALAQSGEGRRMLEFRVGVADSVAKSVAYRLIEDRAFGRARDARHRARGPRRTTPRRGWSGRAAARPARIRGP